MRKRKKRWTEFVYMFYNTFSADSSDDRADGDEPGTAPPITEEEMEAGLRLPPQNGTEEEDLPPGEPIDHEPAESDEEEEDQDRAYLAERRPFRRWANGVLPYNMSTEFTPVNKQCN